MNDTKWISEDDLSVLRQSLRPLVGIRFSSLKLPIAALEAFEPSQIGTIVGALMDALLPHIDDIPSVGLEKANGILGDREGYPDYFHDKGFRVELKLIYVDNPALRMKRPPTRREPSARLTQKVTVKNVEPSKDAVLLIAYQLRLDDTDNSTVSPMIVDYEVFSTIELISIRDKRLTDGGGMWFGDYETPAVLSNIGRIKVARGEPVDTTIYGRKESEGKDFNEDTNFGKLKRIPHPGLQAFIKKCQDVSTGKSKPVLDETS
jgi:hypothetical protein